ncbi:MAG: PAS domain S-box protein [Rhodospirillaceae bacterium]|nr:PAS domain S-box protein [Rhodospirillales bacterium]
MLHRFRTLFYLPTKNEQWLALICTATLLAGIWTAYAFQTKEINELAQQEAVHRAENSVRSFEDYVVANLNLIDNELRFVSTYAQENGGARAIALIEERRLFVGLFGTLAVVDSEGNGKSVGEGGIVPVFIGDRQHFVEARDQPDERLVIGRPVVSRTRDRWVIPFVRAVHHRDGHFGGAISAAVQPELFSRFFDRSALGPNGSLTLVATNDQMILARGPAGPQPAGQNIAASALWKALEQAPQGVYWQRALVDGVFRVYAYHRLENYPLVVAAGVALEDIAAQGADLRRNLFFAAMGTSMVVLLVLAGWIAQQSMRRKLRQSHGQLEVAVERRTRDLRVMHRAFEQSPNMVIITDGEGRIAFVNAAFTALSGYASADVLGRTPAVLASGTTSPQTYAALWKAITAGGEWSGELIDRRRDGSMFWVYSMISPVFDDDGTITHYVAIQQDITERKETEIAMAEAHHQAEAGNRAKSELLANMSHELRTPLNAIIGFADMMKQEMFGPHGNAKYRDYANDIFVSGQHLLGLINDILDVSAIEAGKLTLHEEAVDLAEVLTASIRLIAPVAEKGELTVVEAVSPLPKFYGDERRLKQIILNLLSNSVKFTPRGGTVRVAAEHCGQDGILITVADTGIGIDADGLTKAMQPFGQVDSQLQRKYEGTGLGLPLTKSLIELHDGSLSIDSCPGIGTTVTVRFPHSRVVAG